MSIKRLTKKIKKSKIILKLFFYLTFKKLSKKKEKD